ncbi:Cullin repeat-like-containing domain protein [Tuber brumale]|nr:Cullin repeat-like-containing domain protein [Tuber brumale]
MNSLRMDERSTEVEVLEPKLSETPDISTEIALSFKKLSASAQHVEWAVKPIYNKTQSLTVPSGSKGIGSLAKNVIGGELSFMQYRRRRAQSAKELTLTTPLHRPSKTGLTEYLDSLRRVNEALSGLNKSNLRRSQKTVTQMTSRSETGSLQLEDLFRQALAEGSKSVEPLHFITKGNVIDEPLRVVVIGSNWASEELPFPTLRPQNIYMLAVLNDFLSSTLAASAGIQSNARRETLPAGHLLLLVTRDQTADRMVSGVPWYNCKAYGVFEKTLADLDVFVKPNMAWDSFLAFDVIENIQPASVRLKTKTGKQGGFAEALRPLRTTAQSSFSYFVEDVKKTGQGLIALSLDNTVAEMTEPDVSS